MYRMGGMQLINKVLVLLVIAAAVAGVTLGGLWLLAPGNAVASGHSATRSFSATSVDPGDMVTVTIRSDNYGGFGQDRRNPARGLHQPGRRRPDGQDHPFRS